MIKVEATEQFTLSEFGKIKNLVRANPAKNEEGRLYARDIFECDKEMVEYLTGKNAIKKAVVKVIEVIPLKDENEPIKIGKKKLPKVIQVDENVSRETTEEKPKKKGRKKIDTEE